MPAFWLEKTPTDLILHNKYGVYSKQELETQLREGHLTADELGEIYELTSFQIVHVLRSLCITYRNSVEDTRVANFEITPLMHQVLLGTLMGDAFMRDPRYYGLGHSINQMDYLYHVAEQLGPIIPSVSYKKGELGESVEFWTNRHSSFVPYFDRFYSHGKKKKFFTKNTVSDLVPAGLAYWYMDDGTYRPYGASLCVGNITEGEGTVLVNLLRDRFNINSNIQVHDAIKGYLTIYIKADSRAHFFSLIAPYVPASMNYKLIGGKYPLLGSKLKIADRHIEFCKKVGRPVKFHGDKEIKDMIGIKQDVLDPKRVYVQYIQEISNNGGQVSCTKFREVPDGETLRLLFDQDLTDDKISKKLGFGRNRIAELRKSLGIPIKVRRGI